MLARRTLPPEFAAWNDTWAAPHGRPGYAGWPFKGTRIDARRRGPFAFQANNSTREYEYPWAYHEIIKAGGKRTVIDVGGSLCGLQFVLALEGHEVINVDPGLTAEGLGWDVSAGGHRRLCDCFAPVALIPKPIQDAGIPDSRADVVVCISALEHFGDTDMAAAAEHMPRILKPGGLAVLTIDLFLDLEPFTDQTENRWGRNMNVKRWLDSTGLELVVGTPAELYGFPGFSANAVLRDLSNYHVGHGYPAMAQCVVARKRGGGAG